MEYPGKQGNQNKKNVIEIDCGDEGGNVELADAEVDLKKKSLECDFQIPVVPTQIEK